MPTIMEMQSVHIAAISVLQHAVAGEALSAAEKTEATDWLAGLAQIIARDPLAPIGEANLHYSIYNTVQELRRRNAAAAEAPTAA